jgi:hypothetical protein
MLVLLVSVRILQDFAQSCPFQLQFVVRGEAGYESWGIVLLWTQLR